MYADFENVAIVDVPVKGIGCWIIKFGNRVLLDDDGIPMAFGSEDSAYRWIFKV